MTNRKISQFFLISSIIISILFFNHLVFARDFEIKSIAPYPHEVKTLPEYCIAKLKYNMKEIPLVKKWKNIFKKNYVHMHHY